MFSAVLCDRLVTLIGTLNPRVPDRCRIAEGARVARQRPSRRSEFSACGVLVRRLRGQWVHGAVRRAGAETGHLVLPKGLLEPGEAAEAAALREIWAETGARGRTLDRLGRIKYWFRWEGEPVFKVVTFASRPPRDRPPRAARAGVAAGGGGGPLAAPPGRPPAARLAAVSGRSPRRRRSYSVIRKYDRAPVPSFALNFYSPVVEAQLRSHRKTATIRLGDKSRKYQKGMIVAVLVGARYGPRQHIFDAVIDKVEVKRLSDLSPREIEHDNPEVRRTGEMAHFLSQLYNREVTEADTVTVIRFSAIKPSGLA